MSWAQAFCLQEGAKAYQLVPQRPVLLRCTPVCAVPVHPILCSVWMSWAP